MATKDIPLSVANIRALRNGIKELARELREDIPTQVEQNLAEMVATEVRSNIAAVASLGHYGIDGNYDGADPSAVSVQLGFVGHDVVWRGTQIGFIEFGTGAAGAAAPYGGPAMGAAGYHPDPTKDGWWYRDAVLGPWYSLGLRPQAPMLNATPLLRSRNALRLAAGPPIREALNRAVTV